MKLKFKNLIISTAIVLTTIGFYPSLANAHHSFRALYDYDSSITILGKVSKIDYINPHIFFNVDVEADGETTTYRIETMQANLARSYDFHKDTMAVGDPVEVIGWTGIRDGTELGGQELILRDGTVFKLRSQGASPGNPKNKALFGFVGETRSPSPEERMGESNTP